MIAIAAVNEGFGIEYKEEFLDRITEDTENKEL